MLFWTDLNGDGIADHICPVFGYETVGGTNYYATYNNSLEDETPLWVHFQLLGPSGQTNPAYAGGVDEEFQVTLSAPVISSVGSVTTNGFATPQNGLLVVFTNTTTGGTNWIWNFGNGTIITNTTGGNVTNTYYAAASYTVTLTVNGPGGSSTNIMASYIKTSPTPTLGKPALSGGKLVFSGTNCPVGGEYRILTSTDLTLARSNWTPVITNYFLANGSFSYTNTTATTNSVRRFFLLISP